MRRWLNKINKYNASGDTTRKDIQLTFKSLNVKEMTDATKTNQGWNLWKDMMAKAKKHGTSLTD